jgi:hypothetical protein
VTPALARDFPVIAVGQRADRGHARRRPLAGRAGAREVLAALTSFLAPCHDEWLDSVGATPLAAAASASHQR